MKKTTRRAVVALGLGAALTASLAACAAGQNPSATDEKVTITITDRPPTVVA